MANIATISTPAIRKENAPSNLITPRALLRVMTKHFGSSYCVPTWTYDDCRTGILYLQHGEKWSPTGMADAWNRYGHLLERIWVRWHDSGADHGNIFVYDSGGLHQSEHCVYAFDQVRILACKDFGRYLTHENWRQSDPLTWVNEIDGTYLADNPRFTPLADDPAMATLTTPTPGFLLPRETLYWRHDSLPSSIAELESAVMEQATAVEFLWRGRRTSVYQRWKSRWRRWQLDDWDNCVSPGWLNELARRRDFQRTLRLRRPY